MAQSSEIEKLERRWADNPLGLTFAPLAEAYRRAGDHPRALEVLEVGLGHHPAYVPALIVRARCHLDAGLDAAAEEAFRGVLGSDAHNLIALKGLADICERADRLDEVRGHLDRLLEADPTHDEARAQHARVSLLVEARRAAVVPLVEMPFEVTLAAAEQGGAPDPAWGTPGLESAILAEDRSARGEEATAPSLLDSPPAATPAEDHDALTVSAAAETPGSAATPELVIERETSPFEGFDPASWDLPFGDIAPPDRPFEESSPLAPITLEQVYEASNQTSPGGSLDRSTLDWPGSNADSGESGSRVEAPSEATTVPDIAMLADSHDRALDLPEPEEVGLPELLPELPSVVQDSSEPSVAPGEESLPLMDPMDIPDFVAWATDAPVTGFSGAEVGSDPGPEVTAEPVPLGELSSDPASVDHPPITPAFPAEASVADHGEEGQSEAGVELNGGGWTAPAPWVTAPVDEPSLEPQPMAETPVEPEAAAPQPAGVEEVTAATAATDEGRAEPMAQGDFPTPDSVQDEPVTLVDGALDEVPVEGVGEPAAVEPELVITETMAEVFLRQGHKPLALAVYAQLLERDAGNSRLVEAVARLRSELLPQGDAAAPHVTPDGSPPDEPVGAFLARVLGPVPTGGGEEGPRPDEPAGGRPTQPSSDPTLELSSIFGEEDSRGGRRRSPPTEPRGDSEPTFDEFFGAAGREPGVVAGAGGSEEDLEQFNAWLRSLSR